MATATLSRGDFDVTLPLIEAPGELVAARDIGKPNLRIQTTGALDPQHIDQRSGIVEHRLLGRFVETGSAYQNAIELANLIKSGLQGNPIRLSIDMPEYDTVNVVPQAGQEQALSLEYLPGAADQVLVNLGLTQVDRVLGNVKPQANTPTASGSGPIQLIGLNNTIDLVQDVEIVRSVGRPESDLGTGIDPLPYYNDRLRSAYDAFEISFQSSDPSGTIKTIADEFQQQLGSKSMTLDFNGIYGMGQFSVVPAGSQALRTARSTSIEGHGTIPTVALRVVRS